MQLTTHLDVVVTRYLDGYIWATGENKANAPLRILVRASKPIPYAATERLAIPRPDNEMASYRPLDTEKTLFQVFAALEPTEEQILQFADRYGPLSDISRGEKIQIFDSTNRPLLERPGDHLCDWKFEINMTKHCLDLWKLAEDHSPGLVPYVQSLRDESIDLFDGYPDRSPVHRRRPTPKTDSQPILDCEPRERAAVAKRVVVDTIAKQLAYKVADMGADLTLRSDAIQSTPRFTISATDLRTAIWIQFAAAVAEDKQYRSCVTCGKLFEVSLDAFRTNRIFCKTTCKLKSFRERKRRAALLHDAGRTPKEIAEAVGSDVKTVRGWLKQKEKRDG